MVKVLLGRHGIAIKEVNEFNILQEYKRLKEKEEETKIKLKRDAVSISSKTRGERVSRQTGFMLKLEKNAR